MLKEAASADLHGHGDDYEDARYYGLPHERQHADLHERLKKVEPRTKWARFKRVVVGAVTVAAALLTAGSEAWKAWKAESVPPAAQTPGTSIPSTAIDRVAKPDAGKP